MKRRSARKIYRRLNRGQGLEYVESRAKWLPRYTWTQISTAFLIVARDAAFYRGRPSIANRIRSDVYHLYATMHGGAVMPRQTIPTFEDGDGRAWTAPLGVAKSPRVL